MKKRLVLKPFVLPTITAVFTLILLLTIVILSKPGNKLKYTYVSGTILDEYIPVINIKEDETIIEPYTDNSIVIDKDYYDYNSDEEHQQKSIILHENTYIQNTGIDYIADKEFDVVAVLDGEVLDVVDHDLLGKTITIMHDNNIISTYQSLKDVYVAKGEIVTQGEKIGVSGNCKLNNSSDNNLHFELSISGETVNPKECYGKKLNELN